VGVSGRRLIGHDPPLLLLDDMCPWHQRYRHFFATALTSIYLGVATGAEA